MSEGSVNRDIERFRNGYLNQLTMGKLRRTAKKRWVVFQGTHSGFYQLKIFKDDSEKVLKAAYTLTKDSVVGTERGTTQSQKRTDISCPYWAVILNNDTVVFQEVDGSARDGGLELNNWDVALKERLPSDSWMVFQLTGFTANELHLTLHVTDNYLCLATMNPPKFYKQWEFKQLLQYKARDSVFCFLIGSEDGGNPEYYEVKAETAYLASRIVHTLKRRVRGLSITIPPQASLRRTSSPDSYDRYTPSPTHSSKASNSSHEF